MNTVAYSPGLASKVEVARRTAVPRDRSTAFRYRESAVYALMK
jgi:hypothetical protein